MAGYMESVVKTLSWLHIIQQLRGRLSDWFRVVESRLPEIILVVALVGVPVVIAGIEETFRVTPLEPAGDCIGLMRTDGQAHWVGPFCFIKDAGANWIPALATLPRVRL